uniref:Neurotransmitter-gated ion-channel ligand-binding domain-containing protein n=1 Tax=Ascaris lumbricoides TaxID=6252 RepID=A0A9J2P5T0_ASCLU
MPLMYWLLVLVAIQPSYANKFHPKRHPHLWINTTYQAEDNGIEIHQLPQCHAWKTWWLMEREDIDLTSEDVDAIATRKSSMFFKTNKLLKAYGISDSLLDRYEVSVQYPCSYGYRIILALDHYPPYCLLLARIYQRRYHLNAMHICAPYRKHLRPSVNDVLENIISDSSHDLYTDMIETSEGRRKRRQNGYRAEARRIEQDIEPSFSFVSVYDKEDGIRRMDTMLLVDHGKTDTTKQIKTDYIVDVEKDDEHPVVTVRTKKLADRLGLNASASIFQLHEGIGISLGAICVGNAPELISDHEAKLSVEGGPIASNVGLHFDATRFDIQKLASTLRNDTKLNDILRTFDQMITSDEQPLASTYILPVLKRAQYDARTPPTLFTGQTVDVRVGIHVQSISNFELTTMDYDMDVWLRMAWRDPRLAHGFNAPILINEETFLKRFWRPDPFFANAKLALFHRVTYLNFYMFVFPDGEIFFESRLYLKPICQLVLCKYPHDNQMCSLRISSLGFTKDIMQFRWFSNVDDAIRKNKHVQLPELYIVGYSKHECNGNRKSGNFSCVEARFYMKRTLGYHMAQTYIPTAICVVFSWISVWLPEEFVDGRIFVSLTVFLTLSAESSSAKEILPKVSYMKRKKAEEGAGHIPRFHLMNLMLKSKRYHKLARNMDTYCKVLYPVIFLLFLIIYRFVIIEGDETKCLR